MRVSSLAHCCACTGNTARRPTEDVRNPYFSTDPDPYKPCHQYRLAFVDGARLDGNGTGIGIIIASYLTACKASCRHQVRHA
ncbi:hypothetical protein OG21DRAFT_1511261 [Imleria badia]|nr:hypothetical protein OG21DRAFT_1511261 [Imleria badia]